MKKIILFLLLSSSLIQAQTLKQDSITTEEKSSQTAPLSSDIQSLQQEIKQLRLDLKSLKKSQASVHTQEKPKSEDDISFEADLRTGYIYYKSDTATSTSSKSTGGHIGFTTKELIKGVKAKVNFYAVEALSTQNTNDDFNLKAGDTTQSYGFIGEAKIMATFGEHQLNLGRQKLEMAHDDSDDIRMLPNLFDAYKYGYKKFHMVHIKSMAGWENGGDHTKFLPVHQILSITDESNQTIHKGISLIHYGDTSEDEAFDYSIYNYFIHDAVNLLYLEASYTTDISPNKKLIFSVQYDHFQDIATFTSGTLHTSFDSTVIGAQVNLEFIDYATTLNLATNQASGDDAPLSSLGGGPYFTSMENSVIDAVGTNDASTYLASIEYDASKHLDGLTLSYAYGTFASADKTVEHNEQDFIISYEKENSFSLFIAYTLVDNAMHTGVADFTLARVFLDIPFKK